MYISLKSNNLANQIPENPTVLGFNFHFTQTKNPVGGPQGFSQKKNVEVY